MHWTTVLSLCGGAFLSTAAALGTNTSDIVPGAYIVEFEDDHDTNSFMQSFDSGDVAIRMKLEFKLFKGVSVQLNSGSDIKTAAENIASMGPVKRMWPIQKISMPNDKVIWNGTDRNMAANFLSKRQTGNSSDTFSPHVMTQVDRLRADGVTGKGMKIGVIDSGIDYMHPALGGCFGPGCVVSYGKSFVDENDSDPLDCEGHGTHVAGIIAAQENSFGFTGAAPGVTLGNYRVFGCGNSDTSTDKMIAAFNQAYEDGSDIITASIGGGSGWPENPVSVAAQRIVEAGVPCTFAASNDGSAGMFFPSSPANGKGAAAIASVDNTEIPSVLLEASYSTGNSSTTSFGWMVGDPGNWGNISLPLWAVPYSTSEPGQECEALPTDTPDLSQKIALIWLEACYLDEQLLNVQAYGARFVLFYSRTPGNIGRINFFIPGIDGLGMVTPNQGTQWIDLLSRNISVTANIVDPRSANSSLSTEANTETGGFVSTYSSWGPTLEMDLKPQFAAPGRYIISTYALQKGGYAVLSGTSMSCPLVAAIYALVGEVRGTLDPATIENLLSATANPNLYHDGKKAYPYLAPPVQQGGGLVQAYDAAHSTTLLSVSNLAFNDTEHLVAEANFTIKNLGTNEVTYTLSNVGAVTAYTLNVGSIWPASDNELTTEGASLSFSSDKITIPGGGEAVVSVAPTPPALDVSRLPVYSGYIALNATNGESLSLPYLGLLGSLRNATVVDKSLVGFRATNINTDVSANQTFSFPKTGEIDWDYIYPYLQVQVAFGTAILRIDVVSLDPAINTKEVLGVKIIGSIQYLPRTYMFAMTYLDTFTGMLEDGSYAPEGTVKFLIRALRVLGDPSKPEDYDTVETVPITFSYTSS
ncbi:subtilase [Melanomma pulvis-pyrius CBS 109.77]|uniref:Subtilase n=1 Tax=Melanomma pulvis-pyrius CBS 109.77 TaxID=1314802 RepID=A0A6A6WXD2_9PLEO|nr:subtilase [Melanomma pulvis-pyrius CBS 109.77]